MTVIANAVDEYKYSGKPVDPEMVARAANGAIRGISHQSYLQTLSDMAQSVQQGNATGALENFAVAVGNRAVPYSAALGTITRVSDDVKAPRTGIERIASRIPFASQLVPDAQTALGVAKQSPQDALSVLVPGRPTASARPDPVEQLITDAGVVIPALPRAVTVPGTNAQIPFTSDQQRRYQQYFGQVLSAQLTPLVPHADEFRQLPLADRRKFLEARMSDARQIALLTTLSTMAGGQISVQAKSAGNVPPNSNTPNNPNNRGLPPLLPQLRRGYCLDQHSPDRSKRRHSRRRTVHTVV